MTEYDNLSLIVDLSNEPHDKRAVYVERLLAGLLGLRARRGRRHWIIIDEAHSFCAPDSGPVLDRVRNGMSEGGLCVVTYSPSNIEPSLIDHFDYWLLTGMRRGEEVETVQRCLADDSCFTPEVAEQLASLVSHAALCSGKKRRGSSGS